MRTEVEPGIDALERVRRQAVEHLGRFGDCGSGRTVYAVELVLEEWLTNVFRHGAGTRVAVEMMADGDRVDLRFEDDGRAFDPTQAPARQLPSTLDEAEPGGLGLFFIRHYSKQWHYERAAGRNVMRVEIDCVAA
ncbi:MAG: ATP-binding protein [Rubrivivax sp.]|nr:ATP-binding protein [Rubrivivax sp.]